MTAEELMAAFEAEKEARTERKTGWVSVKDRLPENLQEVIITFVNHDPEPYYQYIKDVPQVGAAVYYNRRWYWYSAVTQDYLREYGSYSAEEFDEAVEVTHWMPLPEPPEVKS